MKKYFWVIAILIVGTGLRFYHNTDISLWHDEAFSALMIRYPWHEMFVRLGMDVHPPMYYVFLRFWHYVFGDSLLSLRGFSIFFGVGTIWAVYLFVKEAFLERKIALWAAFLVALSPFSAQFSTEARMYTMGAYFAVMAVYFLVKALKQQKQFYEDKKLNMPNLPKDISLHRKAIWNYLFFAVCTSIIILTHYFLLFTASAICFYGLVYCIYHYRRQYKKYLLLFLSYLLIAISFLPWFKTFLFQYRQVGAGYWIPPMDFWSIPGTFWTMLLSIEHNNANPLTLKLLVVVALFSLFFFWRFLRKIQSPAKWLVVLATIAPFAGAIMFAVLAHLKGSKTSVYEERYFLFAGVFYSIALASWLAEMKTKWLANALFVFYCLFNVYAFAHYWIGLNVASRPGMAAAARYLSENVTAGFNEHVFVGTSYEFFNYKYYASTKYPIPIRPLLFTGGRADVSQISHVEGNSLLSNEDFVPDFKVATKPGDTVWLIWTYAFGSSRPLIPNNWQQRDEKEYPDVRPYVGTTIYVTQYRVN